MKYDRDEINAIAILYTETEDCDDFVLLLKVLEPMIWDVMFRYPKYREHQEDIKQEVLIKLMNNFEIGRSTRKNRVNLKENFTKNIPTDYFFWKIKRYVLLSLKKSDSHFNPHKPGERVDPKKFSGYDMYNDEVTAFADLSTEEKMNLGLDEYCE